MQLFRVCLTTSLLALVGTAASQDLMIYPNNNQSAEQQEQDKFQCYSWAKQQTGFDPMAGPQPTEAPPPQQPQKGGVGQGAKRGAVVGGVVGGIKEDDVAEGLAKGAVAGGAVGGMRRSSQKRQEEAARQQYAQEQAAQYGKNRNDYNRAYAACMEGRGYTVR